MEYLSFRLSGLNVSIHRIYICMYTGSGGSVFRGKLNGDTNGIVNNNIHIYIYNEYFIFHISKYVIYCIYRSIDYRSFLPTYHTFQMKMERF